MFDTEGSKVVTQNARKETLALLDRRQQTSTICPSEVARALTASDPAKDWRTAMPAVHAAIDQLMAEGAVQLSWKGKALKTRTGAYRIRKS
ncbi:uncharacterized protein DUF3253 [Sphingomonas sp. BK036]|uniref:DUF3253 domain-containing protein n=1 Tax=Sphingomonas sp. BK036 TaxID=2512122 RepID=UPI0010DFCB46|nr:uncharacterized protein DUF3253 [Sphingomonas sp. BK036]